MSFIKIRNLKYSYKDDEGSPLGIIRDISLDIEKGEYIGRAKTNKLYLIFQKSGEILDYNKFI